jgi:hypothetical protein
LPVPLLAPGLALSPAHHAWEVAVDSVQAPVLAARRDRALVAAVAEVAAVRIAAAVAAVITDMAAVVAASSPVRWQAP